MKKWMEAVSFELEQGWILHYLCARVGCFQLRMRRSDRCRSNMNNSQTSIIGADA